MPCIHFISFLLVVLVFHSILLKLDTKQLVPFQSVVTMQLLSSIWRYVLLPRPWQNNNMYNHQVCTRCKKIIWLAISILCSSNLPLLCPTCCKLCAAHEWSIIPSTSHISGLLVHTHTHTYLVFPYIISFSICIISWSWSLIRSLSF
jgi:hypothetical protein